MTKPAANALRVRYSRTAVHIEGLVTVTTGGGIDTGKGHITYSADTHCSALTRSGYQMGYLTETVETPTGSGRIHREHLTREFYVVQDAYDAALSYARSNSGARICAKCAKAAELAGATI